MNIKNPFKRIARLINSSTSTKLMKLISRVKFLLLLYLVCLLCFACGKKGDPTLKSYEKSEPPSRLSAVYKTVGSHTDMGFSKKQRRYNKRLLSYEMIPENFLFSNRWLGGL